MVVRFASLLFACATLVCGAGDSINGHDVLLGPDGKLLSWVQPQEKAYGRVAGLAWDFLLDRLPVEANGLKPFYAYCCIDEKTLHGTAWPHNPAGVNAMLADSAAAWYAYSGDRRVVDLVKGLLDHQIANGTTPSDWLWASVPYASSDHGSVKYRGAYEFAYDKKLAGRGDGYGVIEPDKAGELGVGYLKFWKLTGEPRYRDAALACANALAKNVRPGSAEQLSVAVSRLCGNRHRPRRLHRKYVRRAETFRRANPAGPGRRRRLSQGASDRVGMDPALPDGERRMGQLLRGRPAPGCHR